jgi:hypothetical protein
MYIKCEICLRIEKTPNFKCKDDSKKSPISNYSQTTFMALVSTNLLCLVIYALISQNGATEIIKINGLQF